jgi:hypothetical protein
MILPRKHSGKRPRNLENAIWWRPDFHTTG